MAIWRRPAIARPRWVFVAALAGLTCFTLLTVRAVGQTPEALRLL